MSDANGVHDEWVDKFLDYSAKSFSNMSFTVFQTRDGFSLLGEYPAKLRKQMGIDESVPIIPFFKMFFDRRTIDSYDSFVPLIITVATTTLEGEEGRVRYVIDDTVIKRFKPIEFSSKNDFFISKKNGKVYEKSGESYVKIDLNQAYSRLYAVHVSSVSDLHGILRRFKIFIFREIPSFFAKILSFSGGLLYWWLKQRFYKYDPVLESLMDSPEIVDSGNAIGTDKTNINFFGYEVAIWTLFTYSIIAILIYLFFRNSIVFVLEEKNALSSIYPIALAIVTIVLYDVYLPKFLRWAVKGLENFAYTSKIKGVTLKV